MGKNTRVTVWNEYRHEKQDAAVAAVYPQGIHEAIAEPLRKEPGIEVRTATLDEPEHGLTAAVLEWTDVLVWWGHMAHDEVSDSVAARVQQRVFQGMGLVVLHSGHMSKPFTRLMGTSCLLRWREAGEKERLWVVEPGHPIADGLGPWFEIAHEEMYGERFDVPARRPPCSSAGSRAATCSGPAAATRGAREGSSTSGPGTKPFRPTSSARSSS